MAHGDTAKVLSSYAKFLFEERVISAQGLSTSAEVKEDLQNYESASLSGALFDLRNRSGKDTFGSGECVFTSVTVNQYSGPDGLIVEHGARMTIALTAYCKDSLATEHLGVAIAFLTRNSLDLLGINTYGEGIRIPPLSAGETFVAEFEFDNVLAPGEYLLAVALDDNTGDELHYYDFIRDAVVVTVTSTKAIHSLVPKSEMRVLIGSGHVDVNHA